MKESANGELKVGAHVSIAGGVFNAPANALVSGCDVAQIFTKNQMQWRVPELSDSDVNRFKEAQEHAGIAVVCVHASYLINLGSFENGKSTQSRRNFIQEMIRAEALGIPYLVVHPGSHLGKGESAGIYRIAESLNTCFDQVAGVRLKVLLETTAGQGSNLGYRFEQLAEMIARVEEKSRVGVCIDTCHIFAAGYELRSTDGHRATMAAFDDCIGLDQIGVIHCNDSKKALGSRLDRHEHIGAGELGEQAFANLVNDKRLGGIPTIIETPGGAEKDRENLAVLRRLRKSAYKPRHKGPAEKNSDNKRQGRRQT